MSTWRFDKESNTDYQGSNTVAGQLAGHQPHFQADTLSSKRNVIATEKGWIRRTHKKNDGSSVTRQIDEVPSVVRDRRAPVHRVRTLR